MNPDFGVSRSVDTTSNTHTTWTVTGPPAYFPPPYQAKWWETVLFWPADLAQAFGSLLRWHLGTYRLYCWIVGPAHWAVGRFNPEEQQMGQACPCTYSPDQAPVIYGNDPDPACAVCFGSGHIWLDWEGNVIGNTFDHGPEERW